MTERKLPNIVDKHVGRRIRWRRREMKLSQERLGEILGLTFQQVQKYERGVNRVSAGRLYEISEALDVPVSYFFDGVSEVADLAREHNIAAEEETPGPLAFLDKLDADAIELITAFQQIPDTKLRRSLLGAVLSAAAAFRTDD